jgi:hypothetical protein
MEKKMKAPSELRRGSRFAGGGESVFGGRYKCSVLFSY